MVEVEERGLETLTQEERKEYSAFWELLKIVPNLEDHIMSSSEQDVIAMAELIHKGTSRARSDDMKSMKATIIDWITPKGQALIPHIPRNVKMGQGFHHECTGVLLCPAGYEWANSEMKAKLCSGQLQVAGDQWPLFLYADYSYDVEDPWNGLLRSGLLVLACFTLTSTQMFSWTDLVTDSEWFYISILELLEDLDKADEVDQLMGWWNQYKVIDPVGVTLMSQQTDLSLVYGE
ncbi:hypothetical protein PISMIDRAFT_14353 [Pisolithus microcarpus 441]|uniref:Uncharacterized protein n=1 Tax=Pisolithus microcarpus 441 TaxID=765257 RepID=A0A0C9Z7S5_9AGAM|nr:hypothetical protein PISMIDRAFT_14353 [Pisolithus microcarpus 441]